MHFGAECASGCSDREEGGATVGTVFCFDKDSFVSALEDADVAEAALSDGGRSSWKGDGMLPFEQVAMASSACKGAYVNAYISLLSSGAECYEVETL